MQKLRLNPEITPGVESEASPEERLGNKVLHFRSDLQKLQVAADMDHDKERGKERG